MKNYAERNDDEREPWWHTLLGCLYFLMAGVGLMVQEMPLAWFESARLYPVDWTYIFCLLIPAIGFAAGWASGFPRWSYPYTGGLLVWSLYLMGNRSPLLWGTGHPIQVWGWRAWIPFLLACVVGFLLSFWVKPSPMSGRAEVRAKPHFLFITNLRQDYTLASYFMFGWMPLLGISFDEIDRLLTLVALFTLTVAMVATALFYQRLARAERRPRVLTVGVIACVLLIEIVVIGYWLPRNGVFLPGALAWGVVIPAVILYPIYAAHLLRRAQGAKEA